MPKTATNFDHPFPWEEKNRRYVTRIERMGIEKGLQQGFQQGFQQGELRKSREYVVEILQMRFKRVPKMLVHKIQAIEDTARLSKLLKETVVVKSLNSFKQLLDTDD